MTAIAAAGWYRWVFALGFSTACLASLTVSAESSVWAVRLNGDAVYLGGTVHLLRPGDYPLPAEFELAYEQADQIYFEVDINSMNELSTQAQVLQALTYNDERTLESVLNDKAYQALANYTARVGLPLMMMQKLKPGMIVTTLQLLEFQRMGFTPQGVDTYFSTRAIGDAKSLGALETITEQIGYLAAMGEGYESEFILMSLADLADMEVALDAMITAWRLGDMASLEQQFVQDMRQQAPEIYESLLRQRNWRWLPEIEAMFGDSETEFVLVGAAHLVGDDGLIKLLRERGYEVAQLQGLH